MSQCPNCGSFDSGVFGCSECGVHRCTQCVTLQEEDSGKCEECLAIGRDEDENATTTETWPY